MTAAANLLVFLALALGLLAAWAPSWSGRLRLFVLQSAALAALAASVGALAGEPALLAVSLVFAALKVWLVPRLLGRIGAIAAARPAASRPAARRSLLAAGAIAVAACAVVQPRAESSGLPTASAIPLAFALVLVGLYLCATGGHVLAHALGFLGLENGVFALAVLTAYRVPGLVGVGVCLDVLVGVLIVAGVAGDVRGEREASDADRGPARRP